MVSVYDYIQSKNEYEEMLKKYESTRDDFKKDFKLESFDDSLLELSSQLAVTIKTVDSAISRIEELHEWTNLEEAIMMELDDLFTSGTTMLIVADEVIKKASERLKNSRSLTNDELVELSTCLASVLCCANTIQEIVRHVKN